MGIANEVYILNAFAVEIEGCRMVKVRRVFRFHGRPLESPPLAKMLKRKIGRLPVVERNGRAIGYLGRADILEARMCHHEAEESRSRGPLVAQIRLKFAN